MLWVVFHLGKDRYALAAKQVVEVLPLVHLKQLPQAPAGVAGMFLYRGQPVPVVDLTQLALRQNSADRLSTRILLTAYTNAAGEKHLLGLMAERVTETLSRAEKDFSEVPVRTDGAPYLGPVTKDAQGLIQRVELAQILTPEVQATLFAGQPVFAP